MKVLFLVAMMFSVQAFAQQKTGSYDCAIKGLLPASPKQFQVGDSVKVQLDYAENTNSFSSNLSEVDIAGLKVTGYVRHTKSGGAFPDAYEFVSNQRLHLILEVSNSGKSARIRSTSMSNTHSGIPVIANLACIKR